MTDDTKRRVLRGMPDRTLTGPFGLLFIGGKLCQKFRESDGSDVWVIVGQVERNRCWHGNNGTTSYDHKVGTVHHMCNDCGFEYTDKIGCYTLET